MLSSLCEVPIFSTAGRVIINVSGLRFETETNTLNRFPETLLGNLKKRRLHYDAMRQEYFFDRHRSSFEAILYFYQSEGRLLRPINVSNEIFEQEIKFFELGDEVIENYDEHEGNVKEEVEMLPENEIQRKIWLLFEMPESSPAAKIVAFFSMCIIWISIVLFIIETLPQYKQYSLSQDNKTEWTYPTIKAEFSLNQKDPNFIVETLCTLWFIFECAIRFGSSPNKLHFIRKVSNIIDMLAILPYFIILAAKLGTSQYTISSFTAFRALRLLRLSPIFKFSRNSTGLIALARTIQSCFRELGFLLFIILLSCILFASAVYYAETGITGSHFCTLPDALWWAIVTMTTVGYGDMVPKTAWSKIIGALCTVTGVLLISLPVPFIVSNFGFYYTRELEREDKKLYLHEGALAGYRFNIRKSNSMVSTRSSYLMSNSRIASQSIS